MQVYRFMSPVTTSHYQTYAKFGDTPLYRLEKVFTLLDIFTYHLGRT